MVENNVNTNTDRRNSLTHDNDTVHPDNNETSLIDNKLKGIDARRNDDEETEKDDNESSVSTTANVLKTSTSTDATDREASEKHGDRDMNSTEDTVVETTTLRIDNFRRPFTLPAVKAFVQEVGSFVDQGFWMNSIKTHCFVTFETIEIAKKTMEVLQGRVWPPETGQALTIQFATHTAMEVPTSAQKGIVSTHPLKRKESEMANDIGRSSKALLKTETTPVIYYLPWTDEQVAARKAKRQARQRRGRGRALHP